MSFQLVSQFAPTGDQPQAIESLCQSIQAHQQHQTLLGVTGSGKTFTMANVIQKVQKPTLIIAHNKTLAAQLYQEFRDFFPHNAVSYFVSYYDYYQPEAYIPTTDTYIEKEATINDEIDKLRLASTTNLLTRPDVIVISSVSCIYNLGSPVEYSKYQLEIIAGEIVPRESLLLQLGNLQYDRSDTELRRGSFRVRGETIQIWPAYEDRALKVDTLVDRITSIAWIDPVSGEVLSNQADTPSKRFTLYPAKQYIMDPKSQQPALAQIRKDLQERVEQLKTNGRSIEAYRLEQKVRYDLEMLEEFGFVNGIENYSRYFDGRLPGDAPFTLLDHFQENARTFGDGSYLTIIDESHITLPQIRGMHNGDRSRKETLIDYGFRLPSALDNRPLQLHEFYQKSSQLLYVSATPGKDELSLSQPHVAQQLIRPTGLLDPTFELRPTSGQVEDLVYEICIRKQRQQRTLVTTLTKKMAEALTEYLNNQEKIDTLISRRNKRQEQQGADTAHFSGETLPIDQMPIGKIDPQYLCHLSWKDQKSLSLPLPEYPKVAYLHSDVETLDRMDILDDLRRGVYDVVVGINLLREGLDLPEVTLVAILDADKSGFLRSTTSLIQTIGRAARHNQGHAILYADVLTPAMKEALSETNRRRTAQNEFNLKKGIDPTTILKPIREKMVERDLKEIEDKKKKRSEKEQGTVVMVSKSEKVNLSTLDPESLTPADRDRTARLLRRRMNQAAKDMDFELAALIRDTIAKLS